MYHNQLWFVVEPDGNGVGSQPTTHDHFSAVPLKFSPAAGQEKLILGRHHSLLS